VSDDIYILGISMTRFGKHPEFDAVDLGAQAALAALADGDVAMSDMDVIGAGNLLGGPGGFGQMLQKQIGQTGMPVYNVQNACATGATALRTVIMAIKSGEADMGLAVGVEKLAGAGLLARRRAEGSDRDSVDAVGPRTERSPRSDGRIGTTRCPACSRRSAWSTATSTAVSRFELFAKISEKNHAHSTLNPLAAYTKELTLERDHGRHHDRLPEHAADVLGQLRRRGGGGRGQRPKLRDAVGRAAAARGAQISASVLTSDPYTEEACQVLFDVNTLTRRAAEAAYEQAGVGPEDLDLVELHDCFATAELVHYDNLMLCEPGGAVDFFESRCALARRFDAR
jgi:acetyl-CoA acyltransferase